MNREHNPALYWDKFTAFETQDYYLFCVLGDETPEEVGLEIQAIIFDLGINSQ